MSAQTVGGGIARLDIDPFSREGLSDPLAVDAAIRETAPVVWSEHYGIWFTGRYDIVDRVFRDYETFESSAGTGLTNTKKTENWRKPSLILENDPPGHTKYRRIMTSILSQRVVRRLTEDFQRQADELVDSVVGRLEFDAATDLAEAFPLTVLPDAVGFAPEGRRHLLPYSNLNFQAQGPRNEFYEAAAAAAGEASAFVNWQMRREALAPGGLGHTIYGFVDDGEITEEDAGMLVRTFLSAGIDTTVFAIQFALKALAENPRAWAALREDPGLARKVFEEALRWAPSSPYIGRTTSRATELAGVRIGQGEKVIMALAAANRDPRRWDDPDSFDLSRDPSGHLAFGTGIHGCVGQMMARMEATSLLSALARRVDTIELAGEPVPFLSNWLRGFDELPVRITLRGSTGHASSSGPSAARSAGVPVPLRRGTGHREAEGMLTLQVASRVDEASGIAGLVLSDPQGTPLPEWSPGAHIDVHIDRPGDTPLVRQYSLCGDPADRGAYRIAVLLEDGGEGGSRAIHSHVRQGQLVRVSPPRDLFGFSVAPRMVFIAGGIGITPILPMIAAAEASGADWVLHYAGREPSTMAFGADLEHYGDRVRVYAGSEGERMALPGIVAAASGAVIYACGPARLLDALEAEADGTDASLHVERFTNDSIVVDEADHPFDVELSITGATLTILPGESILDRVAAAGVPAASSCRGGTCGTCETFVLDGEPDHRDAVLNAKEREQSEVMMICVSRCKGAKLVLAL